MFISKGTDVIRDLLGYVPVTKNRLSILYLYVEVEFLFVSIYLIITISRYIIYRREQNLS